MVKSRLKLEGEILRGKAKNVDSNVVQLVDAKTASKKQFLTLDCLIIERVNILISRIILKFWFAQ